MIQLVLRWKQATLHFPVSHSCNTSGDFIWNQCNSDSVIGHEQARNIWLGLVNCCENPEEKYIFMCVRVTPKTELSKCAAAMMHTLIVKFSFAVQSMVWPTSCWPNNSLLAGGPNYLSSQPQQFILTEEALSPERDPTKPGMHCIVLCVTTSRWGDYDRFAKTYIHSAHPTHHLTLTLSPLSIRVRVVSSFKFQPVFAGSGFWPGSDRSWGGFNLCLLVLGSRESDPGFYNFSGKSSLKLNHKGGSSLSCWNWNPLLQSGRLDFLEIQRQVGCTS